MMGYFRMANKRDMYITYERTYKKRRKNGKNKWIIITISMLLLIGIGFAAFYAITLRNEASNTKVQSTGEEIERQNSASVDKTTKIDPKMESNQNELLAPKEGLQETSTAVVTPIAIIQETEAAGGLDTRSPIVVKGIYITASVAGSERIDGLVDLVDKTEINTMIIDVKDDLGKITYKMDSTMAQEIGATTNTVSDMKALVAVLKEKDIYLIARIVAFKDPFLAEQRQDLAIKNLDGSLYRDNNGEGWVNPYNHQVWDYLVEVATQAAAIGFDEIQFDYIRFSTGEGMNNADFGEEAKTKTKEDIIIEFTKYAYEHIKPLGVFVSADVYGTIISSSIDAGLVGQNYVEMSKYLDYICPMIYPSHFGEGNYGIQYPDLEPNNIIRKVLTASLTKLEEIPEDDHRAVVRPWLQDFTATWIKHHMEYGSTELREQINGVYEAGYQEWLLWNAGCNYSENGLLDK